MSGLAPNSVNIALIRGPVAIANQLVTHPEYQYWRKEWVKIRDCLAGQHEIKRKGEYYLPKLQGQDKQDYETYLRRAVFYNMVSQTQNGMLGQIFRRDPRLENFPGARNAPSPAGVPSVTDKLKWQLLNRVGKDGTGLFNFAKTIISEQIAMGRFGVLVDAPTEASYEPDSYMVGYRAEDILDWRWEEVNGRFQVTRVLLREFVRKNDARYFSPYTYDTLYRELLLERLDDGTYQYRQKVYFDQAPPIPTNPRMPGAAGTKVLEPNYARGPNGGANGGNQTGFTYVNGQPVPHPGVPQPVSDVVPMIRGAALDYIPFVFFGSQSNSPDAERPPLLDIVDLNLSHYMTYAELEHGRFFVAMPVYYAPGRDDEGAGEYHIGPNVVWEVPEGAGNKPGILEFTGRGLATLEKALDTKERQIAAIGGRLMSGTSQVTSLSSEQENLRVSNEYSMLLSVITACNNGLTLAIRFWMAWRDQALEDTTSFQLRVNTDFLSPQIGARELRAIQLMYEAGVIGVDILYEYLRKADVIPPTMTVDDFKKMLDDPTSFIGQPDAQAMRRNFSSRQQELQEKNNAIEHDFQQQQIDLENEELELQKQAAAKVPAPMVKTPMAPQPGLAPPPQAAPKAGGDPEKVAGAAKHAATASSGMAGGGKDSGG